MSHRAGVSTSPRAIRDHAELAALGDGDPLVTWAAQEFDHRVQAWALGGALVVASAGLSGRDRIVVAGAPESVAPLLARVMAHVGPSYRVLGDRDLVHELVRLLPTLQVLHDFTWMDTSRPLPADPRASSMTPPTWLGDDLREPIGALLQASFPDSHARPGVPGVRRWAGVQRGGTLAAVAADAWSCRRVGFVSGVATLPEHRGQGCARDVCRFVVSELLREHDTVGLFVGSDNVVALSLYTSLGLEARPVAAARQADGQA